MPQSQLSGRERLDKIIEEGSIECYPESEVIDRQIIGHGGFALVYKAKLNRSGTVVAVKKLSPDAYIDEEELYKKFVKELENNRKVEPHPNIIRFLGLCRDTSHYLMVFEFADDGTLRTYLTGHFNDLTWVNKCKLGLDVASGLMYLHELAIIHKDLSSTNVLVRDGVAKITDFGLSSILKQTMSTSRGEGNTAYIDPMSFKDESFRRGKTSDIFSLGVILWEISSGSIPCEGRTQSYEIFVYRLRGSRDPDVSGTPREYIELYSKCWDENPDERPPCEQVCERLGMLYEKLSQHFSQWPATTSEWKMTKQVDNYNEKTYRSNRLIPPEDRTPKVYKAEEYRVYDEI